MPHTDIEARRAAQRAYYERNREKRIAASRARYEANKEAISAQKKAYAKANKEKLAAANKARYDAKREAILAQKKVYAQANKEKISARMKVYNAANKEKISSRMKVWTQANKEHLKAKQKEYGPVRGDLDAAKKAGPAVPPWCDRDACREVYELRDAWNDIWSDDRVEVDHIVPIKTKDKSVNGLHVPWNLQIIRVLDNRSKADKYNREFLLGGQACRT